MIEILILRAFDEFDTAIIWMKRHVEKNQNFFGYNQISQIYRQLNDYQNEYEYLQKAFNSATNDEQRTEIYTKLGVNARLRGNDIFQLSLS